MIAVWKKVPVAYMSGDQPVCVRITAKNQLQLKNEFGALSTILNSSLCIKQLRKNR